MSLIFYIFVIHCLQGLDVVFYTCPQANTWGAYPGDTERPEI